MEAAALGLRAAVDLGLGGNGRQLVLQNSKPAAFREVRFLPAKLASGS